MAHIRPQMGAKPRILGRPRRCLDECHRVGSGLGRTRRRSSPQSMIVSLLSYLQYDPALLLAYIMFLETDHLAAQPNAQMLSATLLSAVLLAASVSADLGKAVLFPNGLHDPLSGLDNLYAPGGSYYGVSVPSSCSSAAASLSCDASTIQAVSVTYDDCAQAWTVCRCANANLESVFQNIHISTTLANSNLSQHEYPTCPIWPSACWT